MFSMVPQFQIKNIMELHSIEAGRDQESHIDQRTTLSLNMCDESSERLRQGSRLFTGLDFRNSKS